LKKLQFPWHPYLFALFPILFLFVQNADHVSWRQVAGPVGVTLGVVALLMLLVNLVVRNIRKTSLIMSIVALWFFSFKHIGESISEFQEAIPYVVGALVIALLVWVLLTRRPLDKVTVIANQIGLALVLLQLGLGGWALSSQDTTELVGPSPVNAPPVKGKLPNMYYIVPDGYAREDVLANLYDYDNGEFLSYLRKVGFEVADSSHSNYSQTQLSLTSSLNMDLIHNLARIDPRSRDRQGFKKLFDNNRLMRFLKQQGYSIVQCYTPFDLAMLAQTDHVIQSWYDLTEFSESLIQTTPVDLLLTRFGRYQMARDRIVSNLNRLSDLSGVKEPYFVLAHIVCPHPPFLWDAEGLEYQTDRPFTMADGSHYGERGGTKTEYLQGYKNQVRVLNRLLMQTIDGILSAHEDNPPIIILQGDHGPGVGFHQVSLDHTDVHERFSILNAYYFPGLDSTGIYPSITPVNTFRLVLNAYFGTNYPLAPDRSFYSPSYVFLNLREVTEKLTGR
jgi:hypothetical protein